MFYDKETGKEITESEVKAAVSASGVNDDIEEYLEHVERGDYGDAKIKVEEPDTGDVYLVHNRACGRWEAK